MSQVVIHLQEAVAKVVPPGDIAAYEDVHDKVEAWMYTGSGQVQSKHIRTHTETNVVDENNLSGFLENWGPVVGKKFETKAARDQFAADLRSVIFTNKKVDHFVEIYVPPELGGQRVLETFLFMSRKKGNEITIVASYFANIDKMDQLSQWLPQHHCEADIRQYLSWKLYTQLTREVKTLRV